MKDNKKTQPEERPIDPSRDAQDIFGDISGMTGVTTGNPKAVSAEPTDDVNNLDLEYEPGGVQDVKESPKGSLGVPKESYSERIYNKKIEQGMSTTYEDISNVVASDTSEEESPTPKATKSAVTEQGAETVVANENAITNTSEFEEGTNEDPLTTEQGEFAAQESPAEAGEQSVSGDMPTPDSDDDTLANAQAVGTQTEEDPEHPEELDIGRDIDEAEEYERTH